MASYNNSSRIDEYNIFSLETTTSRTIKFTILLILQLTSVCCSLFLLFQWITKSILRRSLHNQTIIVLVIVSFFQTISDLPMSLEYLRRGEAPSSTFCLIWNFVALSNYAAGVWVMTWSCLERHLLIFHDRLIVTFRGKLIFHYIPLFIFFIVPWMYYFILIFFYPCKNTFYPTLLFCGWCCYAYNNQLVLFNWLTFGVIPTCCITLFSLWLIVRVVVQKRRVQQRVNWNRHRRIVIQLLSISCLYILFDSPTIIIGLIQLILPKFAADVQTLYLFYIVYLLPLLVPFICLNTFHELWSKKHTQIYSKLLFTHLHLSRRDEKVKISTYLAQTTSL